MPFFFFYSAAYRALVTYRAGKLDCKAITSQLVRPADPPIVSSSANCTPEVEVSDEHVLPPMSFLTVMGDNIVCYIAGYVGRQLRKRLNCFSCKEALVGSSQTARLTIIKDRGGLFTPSTDLRRCVQLCELRRRSIPFSSFSNRTVDALIACSIRSAVTLGIFSSLSCVQGSDESHRYFLLRSIFEKYAFVRLSNSIRSFNLAAKPSVRQVLTKQILFLGQ